MDDESSTHLRAALDFAAGPHPDASGWAGDVVATWQAIDAELSPVIGRRGVAALFQRSLARSQPEYPWLAAALESAPAAMDLEALRSVFVAQGSAAAAAGAARRILQAFDDLLTTLVGPALTEQLLRPLRARNAGTLPEPQVTTWPAR